MTEKSLDEQANDLLADFAEEQGVALRQLGIVTPRRQRQINKYEMPMSQVLRGTLPHIAREDTDEELEDS